MPATSCTNPVVIDDSQDNGRVHVRIELAWDGVSTPPNCDGTISRITWSSTAPAAWFAHFPAARNGPACYRIDPGTSGQETRQNVFNAGGLSDRASVFANYVLDQNPPGAGERLLN